MGFMTGKRALIVGVASNRSIAWGISQAFRREGAELAFTYQNDKLRPRVEAMAAQLDSSITCPLDVADDADIEAAFDHLGQHWDSVDIVVHSVGFAPRDQLSGRYVDVVSREGYRIAHEISAYSFAALARAARPMMAGRSGALLTLSYLGAVRAIPNYNVMGPAKASLEANVRFLAADLGPEGIREPRGGDDATTAQHHHRRRGQRGRLPVLGPCSRCDGRDSLRGRRIQPRGHGSGGGVISRPTGG